MERNLVQFRNVSGQPITLGRFTLTPQARILTIRLPFGGFVWNRAGSVVVEEAGQTKLYPVVNVTRIAQIALAGSSLLFTIISLFMIKRRKVTKNDSNL